VEETTHRGPTVQSNRSGETEGVKEGPAEEVTYEWAKKGTKGEMNGKIIKVHGN